MINTLRRIFAGKSPEEIPGTQFIDCNGKPMVGGKVFIYPEKLNIKINCYQDADRTILHTNPIILDSDGATEAYLPKGLEGFILVEVFDDMNIKQLSFGKIEISKDYEKLF